MFQATDASRRLRRLLWLALALLCVLHLMRGGLGIDFRGTIWEPDRAVLHGLPPYPSPSSAKVATNPAVYPPAVFLPFLPLASLPWQVGAACFALLLVLAALATPLLLGVRDRRCIALWLLSLPVVGASSWGNVTLFAVAAVAAAWRWRESRLLAAVAVAAAITIKLFLAPLVLWLVLTRRYATAALATALTIAVVVASWAVIGFSGFSRYPSLLHSLARHDGSHGLLVYAFAVQLMSPAAALACAALVAAVFVAGGIGARSDERALFSMILLASLLATPVLWSHYLALLVVVVALYRPVLRPPWLIAPWLWVLDLAPPGQPRPLALLITVTAACIAVAALALSAGDDAAPPSAVG